MKLYRTCSPRNASVDHFLDDHNEIQAIQMILPSVEMIDEIFSRGPSLDGSRFCPVNFSPVPLYASVDSMTTFYEYCFHLLNNAKFISTTRPVSAVLYFLQLVGKPKVKDISKSPPRGVMSKSSYKNAHSFFRKLNQLPDAIKYKSVRDDGGKINYSIYFRKYIQEIGVDPKKIIIVPGNKKSVEVTVGKDTYMIKPNF
jgi:hypothetical protein